MKIKNYLNQDVRASGGIILIFTMIILVFCLNWSMMYVKAITARSVGESVEHIVCLQCLASCYMNKTAPFEEAQSNRTFKNINGDGIAVDPVGEFNNILHTFNLMSSSSQSAHADMAYRKEGGTYTFEIQMGPFSPPNTGSFGKPLSIQCEPVKCVIEDD